MMIKRVLEFGWLAVEVIAMLVILCVLLHLLIGGNNGDYASFVYANTVDFLQKVPSATVLGVVLVVFLYGFVKGKLRQ